MASSFVEKNNVPNLTQTAVMNLYDYQAKMMLLTYLDTAKNVYQQPVGTEHWTTSLPVPVSNKSSAV
jgi:hypothetical protein